jgi:GT2 family glycosyltransferase
MRVGLVIPVLNNFDQAVDMIYSAKSKHDVNVFIQPQYRYQVPLAAAFNRGIRESFAAGCDYAIVTNDDVIYAPNTIDDLVDIMEGTDENTVMAFPVNVGNVLDDPSEILYGGVTASGADNIEDQNYATFIVKRDFFDKCGSFDENFDPAWWEDVDMKYRIHLLGLTSLQTDVPYVHLMHQTTKKLTIPINSIKSGEYFIKKWGSAKKDLNEVFKTPYNDPTMSPKEWR